MIDRKTFLKGALSATLATLSGIFPSGVFAGSRPPSVSTNKKPNILMILMDQERSWADLPKDLDLPARRAFAESALSFTRHHISAVACGPSRSVIYTGQHIQKTGVYDNPGMAPGRRDLNPEQTPTIGTMLKEQGYYTAYVGKWHLHEFGPKEKSNLKAALQPFGFDEFAPATPKGDTDGEAGDGSKLDPVIARNTVKWLEKQDASPQEKPWFMAVNLINPHDIRHFDATGKQGETLHPHFASELAGAPDTDLYHEDLGFGLPPTFPGPKPRPVSAHQLYIEDAEYFFGKMPFDDKAAWHRYQNYYFNCLRDVDREIASILEHLEKAGMSDDTMVIFTSDHGEMGGAQGLQGKGPFIYKECFGVPLLIRHPNLPRGVTTDRLTSALDLAPTILAAAGLDDGARQSRYPHLKGKNLLGNETQRDGILMMSSIVHCCNPAKKDHIIETLYARDRGENVAPFGFPDDFIDFGNRNFLRGLFDGRYKFGRYFRPDQHHTPRDWTTLTKYNDIELYDTYQDPNETINLAAKDEYRDLVLRLNAHLNRLMAAEAGPDLGEAMPGDADMWALKGDAG